MNQQRLMWSVCVVALSVLCSGSVFATTYGFTAVVSGSEGEVWGDCTLNQRTGYWTCHQIENAGTASLTANGSTVQTNYGASSTYASVASALCAQMTSSFPVQCTSTSGGTLNLTETQYNTVSVFSESTIFGTQDGNGDLERQPNSFPITLPALTGILYPKFKIASIIYATPGNHSNNGYTDTLTDGTTTSTGSNFGVGVTDTFSVTGGFLGSGDTVSWSAGVTSTTGNSTAVTDTIAQATGVLNASNTSGPNAVNHQQDLFIIWLNPAVEFTQTGANSATYTIGTQLQTTGDPSPGTPEMQDHVEVYAQAMMANSSGVTTVPLQTLKPQVVNGQTLPGLANICANPIYYPNSCTLANQCGCVPSDFSAVLNQDPLLNFTATESPLNANTSSAALCTNPAPTASCRYVPIMTTNDGTTQVVELLQGPDDAGGNNPVNTFSQTDSTQTTQTLSESITYSVGYSWDVKWDFAGSGLDFKSQTLFTWGNSESAGKINGSAHQMSVSLSSSTVGCSEYIPIFEDTVYHTFVFQGQAGDTSCP
jgi:hypothetical protein